MTVAQARGRVGSIPPTVSVRESEPWLTRASVMAPLYALDTLAMRAVSFEVGACLDATSPTPAATTWVRRPTWTTAMAPGGPPGIATNSRSAAENVDRDVLCLDAPNDDAPAVTANPTVADAAINSDRIRRVRNGISTP